MTFVWYSCRNTITFLSAVEIATLFDSKDWFGNTLLRYLINLFLNCMVSLKEFFREDIRWIDWPATKHHEWQGHWWWPYGYCYNFLNIMWKVIFQKYFTHDYTNDYKSLQGITFAQETAVILSNMVSQSKQTNWHDIPSYGRDKDNCLYQRYVGYYNNYFDATSLMMRRPLIHFLHCFLVDWPFQAVANGGPKRKPNIVLVLVTPKKIAIGIEKPNANALRLGDSVPIYPNKLPKCITLRFFSQSYLNVGFHIDYFECSH